MTLPRLLRGLLALALSLTLGVSACWLLSGDPSRPAELAPRARPARAAQRATPAPRSGHTAAPISLATAASEGDPAALWGRVLDLESGQPIPGARVAARLPGGALLQGVSCDDAGGYRLEALPAGDVELLAIQPGWLVPQPLRVSERGPRDLRLTRGQELRGRVLCEDGSPVPDSLSLRVADPDPRYAAPGEDLDLDAAGCFRLQGLPPQAPLTLVANAPGWTSARRELAAPEGAGEVLLVLRRARILGRVRGALRSGLLVEARAEHGDARASASPEADAFELALPHEGEWLVRARQPGSSSPWTRVEVEGQAELELSLVADAETRGRVLGPSGAPFAQAWIEVHDAGGLERRLRSDAEGGFAFQSCPGEALLIVARSEGLAPASADAAAGQAELILQLEPLAPVATGAFLGRAGAPLRGVLSLDPGPQDPHSLSGPALPFEVGFDAEGVPELSGLPEGIWRVSFMEPAENELRAWTREVDTSSEGLSLEFQERAPRGSLRGRLGGTLPAGLIQVELSPAEESPETFGFMAAAPLDEEGNFRLAAVPPGRYRIRALGAGGASPYAVVEVSSGREAWIDLAPLP